MTWVSTQPPQQYTCAIGLKSLITATGFLNSTATVRFSPRRSILGCLHPQAPRHLELGARSLVSTASVETHETQHTGQSTTLSTRSWPFPFWDFGPQHTFSSVEISHNHLPINWAPHLVWIARGAPCSLTTCCQYSRATSPIVVVFLQGIKCTILVT